MLKDRIHFSKAWLQSTWILVGILALVITIYLYENAYRGFITNPDTLAVISSGVKEGELVLSGTTESSAAGYSGYSYRVTDGKLILKIRYVPFADHWHPSGDFRVVLSDKDMMGIQQVYLYGKDSKERLLWTRTDH